MSTFLMEMEFTRIHPDGRFDYSIRWDKYRVWSEVNNMERYVGLERPVPIRAGHQLLAAAKRSNGNLTDFSDIASAGQELLSSAAGEILAAATEFLGHVRSTEAPYAGGFQTGGPLTWAISSDDAQRLGCEPTRLQFTIPRKPRRKHAMLTQEHYQRIEKSLKSGSEISAAFTFFSVAQDLYEQSSNGVATVALAAAAETALKQILSRDGDVVSYLLENVPSPPLAKLAAASESYCDLILAEGDRKQLQRLSEARNRQVHSPSKKTVSDTELSEWFGIVERIVRHLQPIREDA